VKIGGSLGADFFCRAKFIVNFKNQRYVLLCMTKKDTRKDAKKDVKSAPKSPAADALKGKIKNLDMLKKEYELPEENLTLNAILRKMSENLELYLKIIQQILQPEEFHSLHECGIFDDKEKGKLLELYKRIIIVHREVLKAEIQNEDKNSLSTIQYTHEEIRSVKPEIILIVGRLQESWKVDAKKGNVGYFG
jgi:hypothetical protein